jgi:hypothetical protein
VPSWYSATIGLPASPLDSSSNASDIPEPCAPAIGSGTFASSGSTVGSPAAVTATPGGSSSLRALYWAILPSAIVAVAMSRTKSGRLAAGSAIDSGLVATAAPRAPS